MRQSIALLLIYVRNGNDRRKSAKKNKKTRLAMSFFFFVNARINPLKMQFAQIYYDGMKSDVAGTLTQHSFSGALRKLSRNDSREIARDA